jgi:hypothetical protein
MIRAAVASRAIDGSKRGATANAYVVLRTAALAALARKLNGRVVETTVKPLAPRAGARKAVKAAAKKEEAARKRAARAAAAEDEDEEVAEEDAEDAADAEDEEEGASDADSAAEEDEEEDAEGDEEEEEEEEDEAPGVPAEAIAFRLRIDAASTGGRFDPKRTIFIGNLPYGATEEEIRAAIAARIPGGETAVEGVRVVRDRVTHVGRGIAYVLFSERAAVVDALGLDGTPLVGGRAVRVQRATVDGRPAGRGGHERRAPAARRLPAFAGVRADARAPKPPAVRPEGKGAAFKGPRGGKPGGAFKGGAGGKPGDGAPKGKPAAGKPFAGKPAAARGDKPAPKAKPSGAKK